MNGLPKIHKLLINNFPKLCPILSAINTATYGWAKFFVPVLKCFTMNECTLKDFKHVYYKRYVDDIFALFNKPEHA